MIKALYNFKHGRKIFTAKSTHYIKFSCFEEAFMKTCLMIS